MADVNAFIWALRGASAYYSRYPECNWLNGDINGDGTVDSADISPFVTALVYPAPYDVAYPGCRPSCDVDQNGIVDFADIAPFINLLMP